VDRSKACGCHDTFEHENEAFQENVFGCATAAIVRDMYFVQNGIDGIARVTRSCVTLFLVVLCVFLQCFLLFQVKVYVTAKAVHDIRYAYDAYETTMYNGSVEQLRTGWHRGDGFLEYNNTTKQRFATLGDDLESVICRIPLSQPFFFFIVIFIWTLLVSQDVRAMLTCWNCLIRKTGWTASMAESLEKVEGEGGTLVIIKLTSMVKAVLIVVIGIPRLAICGALLWLGCRWLAATTNFADLIMNAVGLEFILCLKELIFHTLVPKRTKADIDATVMLPEHADKHFTSGISVVGWVFISAGWALVYVFYLQSVLPMYQWDVSRECQDYMAKRYTITAPMPTLSA